MMAARADRSTMIRIGDRRIETIGVPRSFITDLYHVSMTTSWPRFLGSVSLAIVLINIVFALVMATDLKGIANLPPNQPWWAFYFSMETLATVGYGDMHPGDEFIHAVASVEMIVGLIISAVVTGLIFARFARPRARFLFTSKLAVSRHEGEMVLMARVANQRHNAISDARARLWCLLSVVTAEGVPMRKVVDLPLRRDENPAFMLSWTLFHVIDAESPLHGLSAAEIEDSDMLFTLAISGLDDTVMQHVHARKSWRGPDIAFGQRFADIISNADDGHLVLDYRKFDELVAA